MGNTILLTGISGFIAKHIAAKLLTAGYSVRGSVRNLDRADEVLAALRPVVPPDALARLTFVALDLDADVGWRDAMAGVQVLVHTASPFPIVQPKDDQDLIRPAVQGTLRAFRAAHAAGVTRVVLTSSTVAVINSAKTVRQTEDDWCDVAAPDCSAYAKSKTLAERAAWDFVAGDGAGMALTTINPGFVMGPPLDKHYGSSIGVVRRILRGKDPMMPMLGFAVVDVRDVAEMHLRAVQRPETAGKRYLSVSGEMTMPEIAQTLKAAYPTRRIPTRVAPRVLLRLLALFDPQIKAILPSIGIIHSASNARAQADMAMAFILPADAVRASGAWLMEHGDV